MKTPLTIFALGLFIGTAQAFPPAPYYTLYGIVRDQVGQTVTAEGAAIVLFRGADEIGRTPITNNLAVDQNYELKIRIDANHFGTELYNTTAVTANGLFSLAVEMNGSLFYPIEASGSLTAGKGGERVKLDLNLGIDSDEDGLPDTWEEWQLYQAGYYPDANGWDLSLLDRDGDFDKDGKSNWIEYLAGTFAGDRTDYFEVAIKEKTDSFVRFEFFAITGKSYTLEHRTTAGVWERVPFASSESADRFEVFQATTVGVLPAFCDPALANAQLFRLTVR